MSDDDRRGGAWLVPPSAYLDSRPPEYSVSEPVSCYVTMRDGVDLAVDVYLPQGDIGPLPAILILTPYYRRFSLKPGAGSAVEAAPGAARWRDLFVPRGYALAGE